MAAKPMRFKCAVCSKLCPSRGALTVHTRVHTGEKPYECGFCNKKFSQRSYLRTHLTIHTDERPFECAICFKKFHQSTSLRTHLRIHTGEKPYECTFCSRKFITVGEQRNHIRTHTGEKPFECAVCHKKFRTTNGLREHSQSHLGKRFSCDVCEKKFTRADDLKKHAKTHTGEKKVLSFECSVCHKKFAWRDGLKTHLLRIHVGQEPVECSICFRKFTTTAYLQAHLRVHTGEMPFECTVCHRKFRWQGNLKGHAAIHTRERSRRQVVKGTAPPSRAHVRSSTRDGPSQSTVCNGKTFESRDHRMHLRSNTEEETSGSSDYDSTEGDAVSIVTLPNESGLESRRGDAVIDEEAGQPNKAPLEDALLQETSEGAAAVKHDDGVEQPPVDTAPLATCAQFQTPEARGTPRAPLAVLTNSKRFECTVCNKTFLLQRSLKRHATTIHSDEKARPCFECNLCDKTYHLKESLKKHTLRRHTDRNERPRFECSICKKTFTEGHNLRTHIRVVHLGDKPFECTLCGRRFICAADLRKHLRVHTGEKPFECSVCKRQFRLKEDYVRHARRTSRCQMGQGRATRVSPRSPTGERPFQTTICNSKTVEPRYFRMHLRSQSAKDTSGSADYDSTEGDAVSIQTLPKESTFESSAADVVEEKEAGQPNEEQLMDAVLQETSDAATSVEHVPDDGVEHPTVDTAPLATCTQFQAPEARGTPRVPLDALTNFERFECTLCDKTFLLKPSLKQHTMMIHTDAMSMETLPKESALECGAADVVVDEEAGQPNEARLEDAVLQETSEAAAAVEHVPYVAVEQPPVGTASLATCAQFQTSEACSAPPAQLDGQTYPKLFECSLCDKTYERKEHLQRHTRIHTGDKPLELTVGLKNVAEGSNFEAHSRSAHVGNTPEECTICQKQFLDPGDLQQHLRTHRVEHPFVCVVCNKKFTDNSSLSAHLLVHSSEKTLEGTSSERKFSRAHTLKSHVSVLSAVKLFECSVCKKKFGEAANLREHLRVVHIGRKTFGCTPCEEKFISSTSLKSHMISHSAKKPFKCSVCQKKFGRAGILQRHLREIHLGQKPLKCTQCGEKFNRSINLKSHMISHSTEKPFQCSVCQKKFGRAGILQRHLRVIHMGIKPFECTVCGKKCSASDLLRMHLRTHTGKSRYKCTVCNVKFRCKKSLESHAEMHGGKTSGVQGVALEPYCASSHSQVTPVRDHRMSLRSHATKETSGCKVYDSQKGDAVSVRTLDKEERESVRGGDAVVDEEAIRGPNLSEAHLEDPLLQETSDAGTVDEPVPNVDEKQPPLEKTALATVATLWQPSEVQGTPRGLFAVAVDSKRFECTSCYKTFGRRDHLVRHTRIHAVEKPLQCTVSNKKFAEKSSLSDHRRVHCKQKTFECSLCEKNFRSSYHLERHASIHSSEKSFRCSICKKKFGRAGHLLSHLRVVHMEQKHFECTVCGRKYRSSYELRRHLRTHTGQRPFECCVCKKTFRMKSVLLEHAAVHATETSRCQVGEGRVPLVLRSPSREGYFQDTVCSSETVRARNHEVHLTVEGTSPFTVQDSTAGDSVSDQTPLKQESGLEISRDVAVEEEAGQPNESSLEDPLLQETSKAETVLDQVPGAGVEQPSLEATALATIAHYPTPEAAPAPSSVDLSVTPKKTQGVPVLFVQRGDVFISPVKHEFLEETMQQARPSRVRRPPGHFKDYIVD